MQTFVTDGNVNDSTDVVLIDGGAGSFGVTLPLTATTPLRVLVVKFSTPPAATTVTLFTQGADVFEDGSNNESFSLLTTRPAWLLYPHAATGEWLFLLRNVAP